MNYQTTSKELIENGSFKGRLASVVIRLVGSLPFLLAQTLGAVLGLLMYVSNTRETKIARRNLRICFPEKMPEELETLLKENCLHSGMLACEIAYLWRSSPEKAMKLIRDVEGRDLLPVGDNGNAGFVLILPHLGNWELVNAYMTRQMTMCAMYTPAQLPEVDRLMVKGREKTGLKLAEANKRGLLKLIQSLRKGENIVILPDQEPPLNSGAFAPFFGKEAFTMTLTTNILRKSGARPILAYVRRRRLGRGFDLVFKPLPDEIHSEDMRVSLAALNRAVEESICENPSQYMWGYKRFRKRPEGEESLYKNLE